MPSLATSSLFSQQGDRYTLSLLVTHDLVLGAADTGAYTVSSKQLQHLDVAPSPEGICFALRAAEHGSTKLLAEKLQESALFNHLRDSLHVVSALCTQQFYYSHAPKHRTWTHSV